MSGSALSNKCILSSNVNQFRQGEISNNKLPFHRGRGRGQGQGESLLERDRVNEFHLRTGYHQEKITRRVNIRLQLYL